jgi:hypothetical protein
MHISELVVMIAAIARASHSGRLNHLVWFQEAKAMTNKTSATKKQPSPKRILIARILFRKCVRA